MSVQTLRDASKSDIQEQIAQTTAFLVERHSDALDQMRYHQGMIAGLKLAQELIDERAKNLHG